MKLSAWSFFWICIDFAVSYETPFLSYFPRVYYGTKKVAETVVTIPLVNTGVQGVGGLLGAANDPDTYKNVTELIASKGYPVEDYYVQTPDGYTLSIQRIPYGKKEKSKHRRRKEVAFLLHGLMAASDSFVLQFPDKSLGFVLADAGYDVWMGNFRGNRYSDKHVQYTTDDSEFWDYSIDHLAAIDTPVMMDFVLKATRQKQVYLIGESLGATVAFAALAESPRLNKQVKLYLAMSPVAYAGNSVATARGLCLGLHYYDMIRGPAPMRPVSQLDDDVLMLLCGTWLKELTCISAFTYFGTNPTYANETRFGVYTAHFPSQCSTRLLAHYGQLMQSGRFCKFDYGLTENWSRHNGVTPPDYNLGAVTCPVMLIWSDGDAYSNPNDVDMIRQELPNLFEDYQVPLEKFTHLDFAVAENLKDVLFPQMLRAMKRIGQRRRGE